MLDWGVLCCSTYARLKVKEDGTGNVARIVGLEGLSALQSIVAGTDLVGKRAW